MTKKWIMDARSRRSKKYREMHARLREEIARDADRKRWSGTPLGGYAKEHASEGARP